MKLPPKPWENKQEKSTKMPPTAAVPELKQPAVEEEAESNLRKELITEAVKFITNPKVKSLSISQKIAFLASKKVFASEFQFVN